jgi:hypothetical protein
MAKEWANNDKYHPSNGVLEPRMQMPRAKAIVRIVPTWGDRKVVGGAASRAPPIRPVYSTGQTGAGLADIGLVSVLVRMLGLVMMAVVLVVGQGEFAGG